MNPALSEKKMTTGSRLLKLLMANSKYSFLKNNVPMKECMIF
jgi:hypothetical protein